MKKLLVLAFVALFVCAIYSYSAPQTSAKQNTSAEPHFTSDGKLMRPVGYREWIYLSTGLGMNYGAPRPAGQDGFRPAFTNVFVSPAAYRAFKKTGKWPDRTVFALDVYSSASHGSINKQGHYQDSLSSTDVEVKDSRVADGWAYYNFSPEAQTAEAFPKHDCFACHEKSAAVEHSFVQFYPELLETALKLGVIKPGVHIPLNSSRFLAMIKERGWPAAEKAFDQEHSRDPEGELFTDESGLNVIGYQLMAAGKTAEAVGLLKRVSNDHPKSVNALDSLADAYASNHQPDLATSTTEKEISAAATLEDTQKQRFVKAANDRLAKLNK